MTLHMSEQARHLTKDVAGRRDVEELSLCSVEVAHRPLDERPIPEDTPDQDQASVWVQRLRMCGLPRRIKVGLNGFRQHVIDMLPVLLR
jgi:hypothetical protein